MIDWRDYSYYPETAAELIRQEMDELLKKPHILMKSG